MESASSSPLIIREGKRGPLLLLAHGAGAPMDSGFMDRLAGALQSSGVRVWRFEFDYMAQRRTDGRRRPPPRADKLVLEWRQLLTSLQGESAVFVGGKSMGGRAASLLAADAPDAAPGEFPIVLGCVCFGYPFHPPGKPDNWRTGHFADLRAPLFIAQGERDPFGRRERVEAHFQGVEGEDKVRLEWIPEGNHDLQPPRRSNHSWEQNLTRAAEAAAAFMNEHASRVECL